MFHLSTLPNLSNRAYDVIKWLVTVASPAFIVLYETLAVIWEWQGAQKITLTVAAVALFLGGLINLSSKKYTKEVDALFSTEPPPYDPDHNGNN